MSPGSHVTIDPTQILFGDSSIAVMNTEVQGFLAGYWTGTTWSILINGFNTVADQYGVGSYKAHHTGPWLWM